MTNCPACNDELDDGYCHPCEHDLYDEPEWFLEKLMADIQRLHESVRILNNRLAAFESKKV